MTDKLHNMDKEIELVSPTIIIIIIKRGFLTKLDMLTIERGVCSTKK